MVPSLPIPPEESLRHDHEQSLGVRVINGAKFPKPISGTMIYFAEYQFGLNITEISSGDNKSFPGWHLSGSGTQTRNEVWVSET